MSLEFKEFLGRVKEIADGIAALSADTRRAEDVIKHSSMFFEEKSTSAHVKRLSSDFHTKVQHIKTKIDELSRNNEESADKRRLPHIKSLSKRLCNQIEAFSKIRNQITENIEKRETSLYLNTSPQHALPQKEEKEAFLSSSGLERQKSINTVLTDMASLESLSIELNNIIESTGPSLDKISIKSIESQNHTSSTNLTIERTIRRRKRAKTKKYLLLLLSLILLTIVVTYFGDKILDFFIKLKRAAK